MSAKKPATRLTIRLPVDLAEAAAEAQSNAFITASGRLDCEVLQRFAEPAAAPQPARRRYSFWVEFTPEDIAWFKQGAAERGFRYGPVK